MLLCCGVLQLDFFDRGFVRFYKFCHYCSNKFRICHYPFQHNYLLKTVQYWFVILIFTGLVQSSYDVVARDASIFPGKNLSNKGYIAGFGDLNGDRYTDVFSVNDAGTDLTVTLMQHQKPNYQYRLFQLSTGLTNGANAIRSIILGDFNGRSLISAVILVSSKMEGPYFAYYLDSIGNFNMDDASHVLNVGDHFATFTHQPLFFDYNADMISDLLALDNDDSQWKVWLGGDHPFSIISIGGQVTLHSSGAALQPIYSLFFDADFSDNPQVMLTDYTAKEFKFYQRSSTTAEIDFSIVVRRIAFPLDAVLLAPPVVADWFLENGAGLLLAYCTANQCDSSNSKLSVFNLKHGNEWQTVVLENLLATTWSWMLTSSFLSTPLSRAPIAALRAADMNMDYYPDVVATVHNIDKATSVIAILTNVYTVDGGGPLKFQLRLFESDISMVAPFDFLENGEPDLLANKGNSLVMFSNGVKNDYITSDSYFLKVMVLSGLCSKGLCSAPLISQYNEISYSLPYGIPVSGVTLRYSTESIHGRYITGRGHLITSSAFLALQLPFHLFGLTEESNYVETLSVSLPSREINRLHRLHTFYFIVPKAQTVVIPYQIDRPMDWKMQLFLSPFGDGKVLFVGVALLAAAFIVLVLVIVLQYIEYREDKSERQREMHAFNFDAM